MFSTLDDTLNLSPSCKRKGFDFIGNIFRKKTRDSTFSTASSPGVSNSVSILTASDSLDDCLIGARPERETGDSSQSSDDNYIENRAFINKSPGVRSKASSPETSRCIKESIRVSSLVCLASIAVDNSTKSIWSRSQCSPDLTDELQSKPMASRAMNDHHRDLDLLKSARSRLTILSNSSDLYHFPPNSPVSFNVRDLKEDMDILTISRTDNPYIAAKLDLLSETAERSLLVSPYSSGAACTNYPASDGSSSNICNNNSSVSRQSTIQLHPLLQSTLSSDRSLKGKDSVSLASEALPIDDVDDDVDDAGQESSELALINRCNDTDSDNASGYNSCIGDTVRAATGVESVDISLDNLLDDTSNLHEMMIRSPPPQFPTKLSSFIFPDGNVVSPLTSSPARSLNHSSSPISGHRSVLGWRSRYPPIEKASSDTSAVLSPKLLAAAAKLATKESSRMNTASSGHSSACNIVSSNMLPLQIRRLTRRASSGASSVDKTSLKSRFQ